jgi:hypothetical protein
VRGFVIGSLALVVLYVGAQPNSAAAAQTGAGLLVGMLRRLLSPDVAGIPQRAGTATTAPAQPAPSLPGLGSLPSPGPLMGGPFALPGGQ